MNDDDDDAFRIKNIQDENQCQRPNIKPKLRIATTQYYFLHYTTEFKLFFNAKKNVVILLISFK